MCKIGDVEYSTLTEAIAAAISGDTITLLADVTENVTLNGKTLTLDLDGKGPGGIDTGLRFFDHMLGQIPHHGGVSLALSCQGDLDVDEHHTMEDVGLVLGAAIGKALGDKRGLERYGFVLPMDECVRIRTGERGPQAIG